MKLGEILIKKKWLNSDLLEVMIKLQQTQPKRLGEILLNYQVITQQDLDDALQEQYWRKNGYWVIN